MILSCLEIDTDEELYSIYLLIIDIKRVLDYNKNPYHNNNFSNDLLLIRNISNILLLNHPRKETK